MLADQIRKAGRKSVTGEIEDTAVTSWVDDVTRVDWFLGFQCIEMCI